MEEFYEHFADKRQCLLAAFDRYLRRLGVETARGWERGEDWPRRVKHAVEAGLRFVAELEAASRLFIVHAVEPAALERRLVLIERAAERLRAGRELSPQAMQQPDITEVTLVSGVVVLLYKHVLREEAGDLPRRAPEVVEVLLSPYLGSRRARLVAQG